MSICCYVMDDGKKFISAELNAKHTLLGSCQNEKEVSAEFAVRLTREITVKQQYKVSGKGVDITLSGYDNMGFCLPVFEFDGAEETQITVKENEISVTYRGARSSYRFEGVADPAYLLYHNRNGRYRVYTVAAKTLHIELEENHEA